MSVWLEGMWVFDWKECEWGMAQSMKEKYNKFTFISFSINKK